MHYKQKFVNICHLWVRSACQLRLILLPLIPKTLLNNCTDYEGFIRVYFPFLSVRTVLKDP
jgi:hypothetical protein